MQYDNELKGVLFKNDKRETDSHPHYNGSITINGADYWLSAWINEKKDGSGKYMSLKAKPKDEQRQPQHQPAQQQANPSDPFADAPLVDDDLPF